MHDQKSFLKLNVIWKDDDMFELRIIASNGNFCGTTEVYDTSDSLSGFAKILEGFPKDENPITHEAGKKDSYAFFSMKFYCLDTASHVAVQITLEKNGVPQYRPEEKDKVSLQVLVEPNAIDEFQKQLLTLAIKQYGEAVLTGYS
jgi:hypothetical protein